MKNELKIGLVVLFSAVALFFGVRFLQGKSLFGAGYRVVAVFNDAQGLTAGNPVLLNGVQVGVVQDVRLSPDARRVFVGLGINGGVEIPRGSRVSIGGFAALGDVNVELNPPRGASAGRPLAEGDTLIAPRGTDLFAAITEEAAPLVSRADTLLQQFLRTYTAAEPTVVEGANDLAAAAAQVRFITTAIGQTFLEQREGGTFNRVGTTFETLDRAALAAERAALNLELLTGEFSTGFGGGQTGALRDSIGGSIARLNATLRQLEGSIGGFDQTAVNIGSATARLDTSLARLDTTLALVNSPEGTVGLFLRDPSLYYNANATAAQLQQLLQDFQQNPGRYTRGVVRVF